MDFRPFAWLALDRPWRLRTNVWASFERGQMSEWMSMSCFLLVEASVFSSACTSRPTDEPLDLAAIQRGILVRDSWAVSWMDFNWGLSFGYAALPRHLGPGKWVSAPAKGMAGKHAEMESGGVRIGLADHEVTQRCCVRRGKGVRPSLAT
jgi:hypothetical protein